MPELKRSGLVELRPSVSERSTWPVELARGLALFLGGFALVNLVAQRHAGRFDANLLWVDLRWLPDSPARGLVAALSVSLLAFGIWPGAAPWRRKVTRGLVGVFVGVVLVNSLVFWRLWAAGRVQSGQPIPATLIIALILIGILTVLRPSAPAGQGKTWRVFGTFVVAMVGFPLLQVFCFGKTDYRRPADVAVVLGARVYADGRLSDAVSDRVRTASRLYQAGLVKRLICSGGPGDGAIHETEAMRRMAVRLGVPDTAIILDPAGLNTAATVRNTLPWLAHQRVMVVSEFYHLPRIKLAYARAGQEVFTVPAEPQHWLRAWPLSSIAREVPAFWAYWLRAIGGSSFAEPSGTPPAPAA